MISHLLAFDNSDSDCKPIVLVFTGYYLPGYKAGGILRNIVNTIDNMCNEFEFKIITRDRDLGDEKPYPNIKFNEWQRVGNAQVYYLSPESETVNDLYSLICSSHHHIIFLTSFFDPFTIKVLLNRKLRTGRFKPTIVAPFGEFAWASLGQKYLKKYIYIQMARLLGLYNSVTWRVSSEYEAFDVTKAMKTRAESIHVTGDLPIKCIPERSIDSVPPPSSKRAGLKVVFISRIAREKNLDYALKTLSKVRREVFFDIYGPTENSAYWDECQMLITKLPANVTVNYLGKVHSTKVIEVFGYYDLFFFPTGGEAYGNVIAESLTAGTPVLLSTETPWRNLQSDGLGWDIPLDEMDAFVDVIDNFSISSEEQRLKKRSAVKTMSLERLFDPNVLESNRQLFIKQLSKL